MDLPVVPVANGVFPRSEGGSIRGVFLDPVTATFMQRVGTGGSCLLLPYSVERGQMYPMGVIGRLDQVWLQGIFNPYVGVHATALLAEVSGMGRGKAGKFTFSDGLLIARDVETVEIGALWSGGYPVIDGAGWMAVEGHTEMKGPTDLPITICGYDLENGERLELRGNVGGVVPPERAHTLEHAIIRCLREYAICTPKNLSEAMVSETEELKESLEFGFALRKPEMFGMTASGRCGNPLTNLAHFYLAKEFIENLREGRTPGDSLESARLTALSRLASDLGINTRPGLRVMQGLKRGMMHDDTRLSPSSLKRVLRRFPSSPWG
ncbi:MAG: hypothetical protein NUV93_09090 [Firmicutes bacterium]|nr:hypothetical protein [Bacillota bacterium]